MSATFIQPSFLDRPTMQRQVMPAISASELEDAWFTDDEVVIDEPDHEPAPGLSMPRLIGIGALVASLAACSTFLF